MNPSKDRVERIVGRVSATYRTLLVVLPWEIRSRYGSDLVWSFRRTAIDAYRRSGFLATTVVVLTMFLELLATGATERLVALGHGWRRVFSRRPHRQRHRMVTVLVADLRYAMRTLCKNPIFAAVAIGTVGLGVGANSAIFSVLHGVVLEPLPFPAPDRLVAIWLEFRNTSTGSRREIVASEPEYLEFRQESASFADIAAFWTGEVNLGGVDQPVRVQAASGSANILEVLRVAPALGRGFGARDDRPGADRVVVLEDGLWRRAFGGDSGVVGRAVLLNGRPTTVVGVMPPSFAFPGRDVELIYPNIIDRQQPAGRSSHYLQMIGRLREGVTLGEAQTEAAGLMARWERSFPERHGPSASHPLAMTGLRDRSVGDVRPALLLLAGAVGLVLLLACANVANLLLARAETRHRELSIRAAMGAGRGRLVSQMLTESLVIAIIGGAVGLLLAVLGVQLLVSAGPVDLPRLHAVRVDGTVLGFTALTALLTGVLFGLAPAIGAARGDLSSIFRAGDRTATFGAVSASFRRLVVVGEIAVAVTLVVGAGLLIKSFGRLTRVDPGFSTGGVIAMDYSLNRAMYPTASDVARFHADVIQGVEALPGVVAAGVVRSLPLRDTPGHETLTLIGATGGRPADGGSDDVPTWNAQYQVVSPGYFRALSIRLVAGRYFAIGDRADAPPVAVINQTMASLFWPGGDAIGSRVQLGHWPENPNPQMTIVGVVGDVLQTGLDGERAPQLFVPQPQAGEIYGGLGTRSVTLVVRSQIEPASTMPSVRSAIHRLDPNLPVSNAETMQQVVAHSVSDVRFLSALMGGFSGVALLLGAVGIYGLMAYSVAQRTREIGVRMALGAGRTRVVRAVVTHALILTMIGASLGVGGALAGSRLVSGLVFGISERDPVTFALAPALLCAVSLLAAYLPARKAATVDPVEAMRGE